MSIPVLPNQFAPTLGAAITNVSASLTLSVAAPDAGHVWMIIDSEGLDGDASGTSVTNLSRASFKVNGTASAASHSTGATVTFVSAFEAMKACFPAKVDEKKPSGGTITFSSIPQTGTTLEVIFSLRGDTAAVEVDGQLQINADATAGNYTLYQSYSNNSATTQGLVASNNAILFATGASATAGKFGKGRILIPNYTEAVNNKEARCDSAAFGTLAAVNSYVGSRFITWNGTAAVTSLVILPTAGNWAANSIATLYIWP